MFSADQDAKADVDSQRYLVESINAEKGVDAAEEANHKLQKQIALMNARDEATKAFKTRAAELELTVKGLKKPLADAEAAKLAAETLATLGSAAAACMLALVV